MKSITKIIRKNQLSEFDFEIIIKKFKEYVDNCGPSDFIKFTIGKNYPKRSLPTNDYYWVLMTIYGDVTGMTKKQADAWWLSELKPTEAVTNTKTGEVRLIPLSTSRMNTQQMSNYIEEIKREAMIQDGIYLPEPGEAIKMEL